MRSINTSKFNRALKDLKDVREGTSIRGGSSSRPSVVFVKHNAKPINWNTFDVLSREDYTSAFLKRVPSCVTANMRTALVSSGMCKESLLAE